MFGRRRRRRRKLEEEVRDLSGRLVVVEYWTNVFHAEHKAAHPERYLGTGVLARSGMYEHWMRKH